MTVTSVSPRFAEPKAYDNRSGYRLLPFRFTTYDGDHRLLVNEAGEHEIIANDSFVAFVRRHLPAATEVYARLKSKQFLADSSSRAPYELLVAKYRTKRAFLAGFTKLHIFVVSLRCEHTCLYCQVSRVSVDRERFDMSERTADRALDLTFRSPASDLKIEFQGGEPLLNFPLIRHVVLEAERRTEELNRHIEFVVTTNLALIDDDMLSFLADHRVGVSTSLDGPDFVHNANRPRPGRNSYELAVRGIERVRNALGRDSVSALMTATRLSLGYPREIVDEYARLGFRGIFLRSLSPYGFATKTAGRTGYTIDEFLTFYREALDHIVTLNRSGTFFVETFAQILLTKILTPFSPEYVDLQSPSGAGIGAAVYNYDGYVYPSDEARMLTEMGDTTLRLGNVHENSYEEIFGGSLLKAIVQASIVESTPMCSDCALQPFCGSDPTFNYAMQGDFVGSRPTSDFHRKNDAVIRHLLHLYHSDRETRQIFWSWVQNRPAIQLLRRAS